MKQIGSPGDWLGFIDSQVPAIIDMVIETWESFEAPYCDELEDRITAGFVVALRHSRVRCDLPFRIDPQLVELDPAPGEEEGRMDIVFSPPATREDIYFCLECKRLNVCSKNGVRGYYSEYVIKGMLRFIRGQYAQAARNGAMVGYVLDGNIQTAIQGVENNLEPNAPDLGMESPAQFSKSSIRAEDERMRETEHNRKKGLGRFLLHHIFLPSDPRSGPRPT